ncbi:MAG: hypothetical protein UY28_C0004G0045 [Candidatus Amesbacteria bacterium GW2011_GWB1_48_13]|uniref:Uncharacterized protein n=1 Tax=Candidatus Amesbacteria bacterium GW2011_GWB1_48_13 TaxID=1618362 RepID=A0A0G1UVY3_9BACT|nr:MAG: hypothetical protein UY28_C0004G0045 [Candidatus Amesbacteria bacterium GW2011_GWB1_48_13]
MATYLSDNYKDPIPEAPGVGILICREFLFTVSTALALNDIIKLMPVNIGMPLVLDDWFADFPELDTGVDAIALQLGDTDTAAKFMAANTVGQAGGKRFMSSHGAALAVPVEYARTSDKDFRLTVSTGPGTGATGVAIRGWFKYHFSGIASPV